MEYDRGWLDHLHELEQNSAVIPEAHKPLVNLPAGSEMERKEIAKLKQFVPTVSQMENYADGKITDPLMLKLIKAYMAGFRGFAEDKPKDPILAVVFINGANDREDMDRPNQRPAWSWPDEDPGIMRTP